MGQVVRKFARRVAIGDFVVFDATRGGMSGEEVQAVRRAITLIGDIAPRSVARLAADMPHITISDEDRQEYALVMRSGFLPRWSISGGRYATIAAALVGLGARARASRTRGGWKLDPLAKPRLIRLDALAQKRFVKRLNPEQFTNIGAYLQYLDSLLGSAADESGTTST